MTGFLVINHFLSGNKYDTLHNHLINCAKNFCIELIVKTNQDMIFESERPDFVLFWDKDVILAKSLEKMGIPVFNSANSIALCDNKAETYIALDGIVKQPETIIAPLSFFDSDYSDFVKSAADILTYPVVFKECCGSFGEQVYLCQNTDDVLSHISSKPFILQKYIESDCTDIRIEVIDGKCVSAMKRQGNNDFRSNITNGGKATPFDPTNEQKEIAVKACNALGLTFGGVDIIGEDMVCEVNSNAHIINLMNISGIDIAPLIFESILKKI